MLCEHVARAGGELAVTEGPGPALSELGIGLGVEDALVPEAFHLLDALVHPGPSLQDDGLDAMGQEAKGAEEPCRSCTHHHNPWRVGHARHSEVRSFRGPHQTAPRGKGAFLEGAVRFEAQRGQVADAPLVACVQTQSLEADLSEILPASSQHLDQTGQEIALFLPQGHG